MNSYQMTKMLTEGVKIWSHTHIIWIYCEVGGEICLTPDLNISSSCRAGEAVKVSETCLASSTAGQMWRVHGHSGQGQMRFFGGDLFSSFMQLISPPDCLRVNATEKEKVLFLFRFFWAPKTWMGSKSGGGAGDSLDSAAVEADTSLLPNKCGEIVQF